ncbi:hypothetical protein APY94_07485 [Thermococcus celericrescens]|uniref:Eight-cysteine-cluster domain-containing protein n=1 Tax=Thermococcus celericrescens TaxID=227598 RepID=A0A100XXJ2_9EURY|nr:CGP-CTERM-anchored Cys-rich protein [Thermococcus celericrescens]KUH33103.1 hypothetical protein APY94_07485 [Thermococcus celericrescens]
MKRLAALMVLLMFTLTPVVKACMSSSDGYAVEVVLNKPGIVYRPYPAFNALHNAVVENGTFVFLSHYDERLYVMLWNGSDGPHLRVQIPVGWKTIDVSRASLNLSILITEETLEKLRADGWNVTDNTTFERNGVRISLTPVRGKECTSDADCATGGCSGEVCAPKKEAREIVTPCVYKPWYDCLSLTSCGCVNGLCTWKPNPAFESCLREHGINPSKVIRAGYFELEVEGVNRSDDEVNAAVKDFLGAFGVSCDVSLTLVKTSVTRLSPSLDPSEVNASKALKAELEWLIETGALRMDESDVEGVLRAAEWGNAGHNSNIGWYETGNGTFAWIPYDESLNPLLVRCFTREVPVYELPNGTAYVGPTLTKPPSGDSTTMSGSTKGEVCGPGIVVLLALIVALAGRR